MKKVSLITDIQLNLLPTEPPTLVVKALGKVPGRGWTGARLVPCSQNSNKGFYSFELMADSPNTAAATRGEFVETELHWLGFPDNLEGVKVYASDNSKQKQKPKKAGTPFLSPEKGNFSGADRQKERISALFNKSWDVYV